jgi:hypothetical protein
VIRISKSPSFWLVLGISWSLAAFFSALENGFVFSITFVPTGLAALLSYALAIIFAIKRKSLKEDNNEKDS